MRKDPQRWTADYRRDGYLVVENLLDPEHIAVLGEALERVCRDVDQLPRPLRRHVQLERDFLQSQPDLNDVPAAKLGQAVKLVMELPLFDPVFAELIGHPPQLDVLQTLFASSEFHFHNYKAIIKAPQVSSAFVWHRDLPYLEHSSPDLITAMLCLDGMSAANGATVVIPGSHRVAHEAVTDADRDIPESALPDLPRVTVDCPPGAGVFFHVNLIHGGSANRSPIPRRNVIGIWAGPDARPLREVRYAYQGLCPRSSDPAKPAVPGDRQLDLDARLVDS